MTETAEALERRIGLLRTAVREAVLAGDRERAVALRRELRRADQDWEDALATAQEAVQEAGGADRERAGGADRERAGGADRDEKTRGQDRGGAVLAVLENAAGANAIGARTPLPLLPLREQVHEALSLLTVPAAPRLIATVHEAFFATTFPGARLTSLKRDEERSFRAAPFARPYYMCAALTAGLLAPARGLLAISTWPMERRVIGSLSPRVDFLTGAIRVAEAIERLPAPVLAARRLLWRFAASIPGAADSATGMRQDQVRQAALAELGVHQAADREARQAAAQRAREQLDDAQQLFGTRIQLAARPERRGRGG